MTRRRADIGGPCGSEDALDDVKDMLIPLLPMAAAPRLFHGMTSAFYRTSHASRPRLGAFPANQRRVDPIPGPMLHLEKGIFAHSPAHPMRIPSLIVDVREAPGFMVRCCAR